MIRNLKSKKYIEFVGHHGAGKTSIYHYIVNHSLLTPCSAIYPRLLSRPRLGFACSVPLLALQNVSHLWFLFTFFVRYTHWSWSNYRVVGRYLFKMVILHPYYHRFDFDIWFKDDMLHLLPRIHFRNTIDVEKVFREYFEHFAYLYTGLVYVDIPTDVAQKRMIQRSAGMPSKRQKTPGEVYERAFQQEIFLRKILTNQTIVPYLIIDGTDEIDINAKKVSTFFRKIAINRSC